MKKLVVSPRIAQIQTMNGLGDLAVQLARGRATERDFAWAVGTERDLGEPLLLAQTL